MALPLKYAGSVAEYFRFIIDEPDQTFLPNSSLGPLLAIAYDEFRFFVTDIDPNRFHKVLTTPVITTNEFDLATGAFPIMGPLVVNDGDRLQQIMRVTTQSLGTTPPVGTILEPVYSYESLIGGSFTWPNKYILQDTKLLFGSVPSAVIRVEYIPQTSVDWSNLSLVPGFEEWIDDLIQFHDCIALIAAKQYAMVDSATSGQIMMQYNMRMGQLKEFLTRGMLVPANRTVGDDSPYSVY